MPLPPALLARLAKRGILSAPKEPEQAKESPEDEEIIAEDYDETPQHPEPFGQTPVALPVETAETFDPFLGYSGCPNKWNVYHDCSVKCRDQWKDTRQLDLSYERKRTNMLQKYQLPDHWKEILDSGIGRYYYWNTETDLVSWLPPGHPRCQVSRSAATLRKEMLTERKKFQGNDDDANLVASAMNEDKDIDDDEAMSDASDASEDETPVREQRHHDKDKRDHGRDRGSGGDRRDRKRDYKGRAKKDELDPMDPASYGECERGSWSSGLPQRNEARTGADVTASGPLYQMRPYPSPGAVLRANAQSVGPKKPS